MDVLKLTWLVIKTPAVAMLDLWAWIVRRLPDNKADCPPVVIGQGDYEKTWPRGRHLDTEA